MTSIFSTALIGLFALSSMTGNSFASAANAPVPVEVPTYSVAMTGYNAVPGQTDSDPDTTASGAFSNPDIIAARSRDLAEELPFGTVIEIVTATSSPNCGLSLVGEQIGLRVIGDTMNARMRNKVDILFDMADTVRAGGKEMNPAIVLGTCKDVHIRVVGKVDIKDIPKTQAQLRLAIGSLPKAEPQPLAIFK